MSGREREILLDLKLNILKRVRIAGFSDKDIATRLDILPVGVEVLLASCWTLAETIAFADAFGMKIEITVS